MADKIRDRFVPAPLDQQRLEGLLGQRLRVHQDGRLLRADEAAMLGGFERREGQHSAVGEHAGKFIDAASRTWAYTGDERLKQKLDRVVRDLLVMQLPDGYLGTYGREKRWTGADVSVHKYDLIGLLSYYRVTGDEPALAAARKIGELLVSAFGDGPGDRDIVKAGGHKGLASVSILEPICTLYRYTNDERYLNFARYIVRAEERATGPHIVRSMGAGGRLDRTADAHAALLLSTLNGLLELYRLTAEPTYLRAAEVAWNDVTTHRLYLTGAVSAEDHFRDNLYLPGEDASDVGEGCSTVAWLEFNSQLLRLTGDAKYAQQIERTVYNHLLGAQDPSNGSLCPYTPLNGRKHPSTSTANCCVSSEPRAFALIPELVWGSQENGAVVLLYTQGEATIPLRGESRVTISSKSNFPREGTAVLTVKPQGATRFPIFLRVPAWATHFTAEVKGDRFTGDAGKFLRIERVWRAGDTVEIAMDLPVRMVPGGPTYPEYVAFERGPQVLALEASLNPQVQYLHRAAPRTADPTQVRLNDATLPEGATVTSAWTLDGISSGKQQTLTLTPFADAVDYRVWLVRPDRMPVGQVAATAFGIESWSRNGSVPGSICDERGDTYRTTFEGRAAKEDWYAVQMEKPTVIARVVFRHGKVFENGGWFDTSAGKPRVQIKRARVDEWEDVGALENYPQLGTAQVPNLSDGAPFSLRLKQPVTAVAIRIVGKPARAFSSCAELAGYAQ